MQDLIPFFCPDHLIHQFPAFRLFGQIIKTEVMSPDAFVAQSHVPRRFIQVSPESAIPDRGPFGEQVGKYFYHQVLRLVNVMQIAIDV